MLDIIGDIHGKSEKLKNLLKKLGYKKSPNGYYNPKGRIVLFLGDYIDRGENQTETLEIVKTMVENGNAKAIMGNHEFNAICYATKIGRQYLREHSEKNTRQHQAFLDEYPLGSEKHISIIEWLKTLPLFIEMNGARFVHAAWNNKDIDHLRTILDSKNRIKEETYINLFDENHQDFISIENTLKGIEYNLPENKEYEWTDHDGNKRNTVRIKWFEYKYKPLLKDSILSLPKCVNLPDAQIDDSVLYKDTVPVFFGHYWMKGKPVVQNEYTACLDYSAAKDGVLVCYRYDKETTLNNNKFVF